MSIEVEVFGKLQDTASSVVHKYKLKNNNGYLLECTNYGVTILNMETPDRNGISESINIGYKTIEELQNPPSRPYFGAIIGRFSNRIAGGRLTIDGEEYQLATNNGVNHLHGGMVGFDRRLWTVVKQIQEEHKVGLEFEYHSPDGEENYPGNVQVMIVLPFFFF
jgi:aldose 1-epimerase